MKKYNKALIALLVAAMGIAGVAGVASARGWHGSHGGGCNGQGGYGPGYGHGGGHGYGYGPGGTMNLSPEVRGMMEKSYTETAPLFMELRAKQTELTAKIYGGADDKTVQDLSRQVNDLQTRLNDARVRTQQQLAKAGVPLNGVAPCPGMGGMGFHGRMHNGFGYHGGGYGPCAGYAQQSDAAENTRN